MFFFASETVLSRMWKRNNSAMKTVKYAMSKSDGPFGEKLRNKMFARKNSIDSSTISLSAPTSGGAGPRVVVLSGRSAVEHNCLQLSALMVE